MNKFLLCIFGIALSVLLFGCVTVKSFICTPEYALYLTNTNSELVEEKKKLDAYKEGVEIPWENLSTLSRNHLLSAYQRNYNNRLTTLIFEVKQFNTNCAGR